jgi:hypothetical protein
MVKSEHVEAPTLKANLRAARDFALPKEQRQKAKLMLPYCTPHGLFKENRKDENLKRLSGIICLDFDRTNEDKQHIEMLHAKGMEAEASAAAMAETTRVSRCASARKPMTRRDRVPNRTSAGSRTPIPVASPIQSRAKSGNICPRSISPKMPKAPRCVAAIRPTPSIAAMLKPSAATGSES